VVTLAALVLGILWWLSQKPEERLGSSPPRRRENPNGSGDNPNGSGENPGSGGLNVGRRNNPGHQNSSGNHNNHGNGAGPSANGNADPKEVRAAINRANAECLAALEAGDAHAYAQHFADDSISLPGRGPMVRGRVAIEEAMEDAFGKVRFSDAEWETLETRYNGKTAYETGAYKFVVRPAGRGTTQTLTGRYFVVWKKIGDQWKIAVDAAQPGAPAE
jgi:uncharacterized protein (TIGR02246 family)